MNASLTNSSFTLNFFDKSGGTLKVPVLLPQFGLTFAADNFTRHLAAGAMLVVETNASDFVATFKHMADPKTGYDFAWYYSKGSGNILNYDEIVAGGFAPGTFQLPNEGKSWSNLSGRIMLSYKIQPDVMLYASFSRGFKAGEFDFNTEYSAKNWVRGYIGPRFRSGEIFKGELAQANTSAMQGFVFNLRRPMFQDRRVRDAIGLMQRMVADGAIGEVRLWRATWLSDEFTDPSIPFDWRFERRQGGTTIADLGAHLLEQAAGVALCESIVLHAHLHKTLTSLVIEASATDAIEPLGPVDVGAAEVPAERRRPRVVDRVHERTHSTDRTVLLHHHAPHVLGAKCDFVPGAQRVGDVRVERPSGDGDGEALLAVGVVLEHALDAYLALLERP